MANPSPRRNQFQPQEHHPITKQQRRLWADCNDILIECGGWSVSQPDTWPMRFEASASSSVVEVLRDLGHSIRFLGTHERIEYDGPAIVLVHEISLFKPTVKPTTAIPA